MAKKSVRKPPVITAELKEAVLEWLRCKAQLDTVKPVIEKIQADTLAAHPVRYAAEWNETHAFRPALPEFVEHPKYLYLGDDNDYAAYHVALHAAYTAAGYDAEGGKCPLLTADWKLTQAENAICKAAEYVVGAPADDIILLGLEGREEYIDTMIGLVMSLCPDVNHDAAMAPVFAGEWKTVRAANAGGSAGLK